MIWQGKASYKRKEIGNSDQAEISLIEGVARAPST